MRAHWPTGWWGVYYWGQAALFSGMAATWSWPVAVLLLVDAIILPPLLYQPIDGGDDERG